MGAGFQSRANKDALFGGCLATAYWCKNLTKLLLWDYNKTATLMLSRLTSSTPKGRASLYWRNAWSKAFSTQASNDGALDTVLALLFNFVDGIVQSWSLVGVMPVAKPLLDLQGLEQEQYFSHKS